MGRLALHLSGLVQTVLGMQVNSFLPCHLADMVSAYAHMVHHPGPLLDQMTQRILPKLDTMDAGRHPACMLQQRAI